jgi:putative colanic acid biosynthesis acetyltransferase WcaF
MVPFMVDLSQFRLGDFTPERSLVWQALWFAVGAPLVRCSVNPFSSVRRVVLRAFGARIGKGVTIRPGVRVKYPWKFTIGEFSMVGEDAWIDNLAPVTVGAHVCISQGAYLCTGNHDWSCPFFSYRLGEIRVGDGAWIGARALVGPGVELGVCAVVGAGSVCTHNVAAHMIVSGNPAEPRRKRVFRTPGAASLAGSLPRMRW